MIVLDRLLPGFASQLTQLVAMTWVDRPPLPDSTTYHPQRSAAVALGRQPERHLRQLVLSLLKPYGREDLTAYPLSKIVNRPANESPGCITRLDEQSR